MRFVLQRLWPFATLVLLVFLLYRPALSFPFVSWDDFRLITENPAIKEITPLTLWKIFTSFEPELYIPLAYFTYQLEYQIAGLQPLLYHLDNILLHAFNACLVFALITRWSRSKTVGFLSAVAFAVHPLNVEAVAWVSARKDLLSALFAFASLLLYEHSFDSRRRGPFIGSIVCFALSLLAKISAVPLPLVLLLLDWMNGRRMDRKSLLEKIPFFALSLLFGIVALFGKSAMLSELSLSERPFLAFKGILFMTAKLLVPHPLSIVYPPFDISLLTFPFLFPLALAGIIVAFCFTPKGRSVRSARMAFFAALLLMLPIAIVPQDSGASPLQSDKHLYLAMPLLLLGIGAILHAGTRAWGKFLQRIIAVFVIAVLLLFSFLSFRRLPVWEESLPLYSDVLRHFPKFPMMHTNIDIELIALEKQYTHVDSPEKRRTETERSVLDLHAALRLAPDSAISHHTLGSLYVFREEWDAAIAEFRAALAINPRLLRTRHSLISAYMRKGMVQEAREETQKALEHYP